ncbi:MAG: BlaI/MecI/CopY family transcriptional regulator [Rikenellaceae bacterium]|nr:BlaI/MecI/CopY family transcriptional regulator [Rikenellaceae bacterium]
MERKKSNSLTRGEEEIMQILWSLGEANVGTVIDQMENPKPAYTTVATFMKIMEDKGYVARKPTGSSYTYYPLIQKEEYAGRILQTMLNGYFGGSPVQLVSFFADSGAGFTQEQIAELEEIIRNAKE